MLCESGPKILTDSEQKCETLHLHLYSEKNLDITANIFICDTVFSLWQHWMGYLLDS